MALPNTQAERLRCFLYALWNCEGYVRFNPLAQEWLQKHLADWSKRRIAQQLHEYVENGGEIDEQVERRPEYVFFEFHYDLRVEFGDRRICFETVLIYQDPKNPGNPMIEVVNIHDA